MRWTMTARAIGAPTPLRRASPLRWRGDERLALLAAAGDERAFGVLYERHHQALYRYCRSIVRDEHDAQDALQAAMTAALAGIGTWRPAMPIRAWLFRIAHNEAVSLLRRRRPVTPLDEAPEPSSASAESQVGERERLATLVADLQDLPERQRAALVMRELSGLGHDEIAGALSTSTGAAKQAIFEARLALAEFGEGREMDCDAVRRTLSDGDRRMLRGRRIRAHLRDCAVCASFQAAIPERHAGLTALAPPLPAAAAAGLLARILAGAAPTAGLGAPAASVPVVAKVVIGAVVLAGAAGTTERVVRPASPEPARTAAASAPARSAPTTATGVVLTRTGPPIAQLSAPKPAASAPGREKSKHHKSARAAHSSKARAKLKAKATTKAKAKGRPLGGPGSRRAAPAAAKRAARATPRAPAARRSATRPSHAAKRKGNAHAATPQNKGSNGKGPDAGRSPASSR
jgi:RNA polymerase sigma factor (sigma-70 family)